MLAGGIGAVMAADAVIGDVGVIEDRRYPGVGRMAIITVVTTGDVRRVLALGRVAIVAREAGADDLCVINHVCRRKRHVVVAVLTNVGGINVSRMLAGGIGAVMAADAVSGDVGVIEVGRYPGVGRMAIITVVATGDVRRILALGRVAIVAREAGADDLRVIDHVRRRKRHNIVTVFANHGRVDVSRVLADGLYPVMTT